MTLMICRLAPSGTGWPAIRHFAVIGRQRPGNRPAEPQGFGIQELDSLRAAAKDRSILVAR